MNSHDPSYKLLFSHPQMVRDLLIGFVNESWVADLDFDTLEQISGSYISDDLREREDDLLWRVQLRDSDQERWLYLYLLLEFQSSVDSFMAVRLLTYIGLLYQDLIKQRALTSTGKLPPVLPIVLYNGKPRWTAATELFDLIEPTRGRLRQYAPHLRYLLLDEGAIDESAPWELKNLVAALFRLEKSRGPQPLQAAVSALTHWLEAPEQASLRRAFTVWIKRVLIPARMPGVNFPELGDLLEIKTMLAESVLDWTQEWKQQGLLQGLHEGLQQGLQEGLQQGLQEGLKQGLQEGLQQGLHEGRLEGHLEGRLEGEASLLERQLIKRFGVLSESTRARLRAGSSEERQLWAERIFDALSVNDVFSDD
ncbi:transposase [Chromatium weissei]|nr:transposase [Chromatium weissei]